MDKQFVMHRVDQLKMLAEILEHIAEGKVTANDRRLAIELSRDNAFLLEAGKAIGMQDSDIAVKMLAGHNDNLDDAHLLLQLELRKDV